MMKIIKDELIDIIILLNQSKNKHVFIPILIRDFEYLLMRLNTNTIDFSDLAMYASGIGRIISEDDQFCESEIGERTLSLLNKILNNKSIKS